MVGINPLQAGAGIVNRIIRRKPAARPPLMHGAQTPASQAIVGSPYGLGSEPTAPQTNPYNAAMLATGNRAVAGADFALAQLRQQMGLTQGSAAVDKNYLTAQQGFANQNAALSQQGITNERSDLASRGDYLNTGFGLDRQSYDLMAGTTGRQLNNIPKYEDIANQAFGLQEGDLTRGAAAQNRNVTSNATARGAIGSQGYRDDVTDINQDLASSLSGVGLDRRKSYEDFREQAAGINDTYNRGLIGFRNSENQFNYSKQQLDSAGKQLDLESQKLGISTAETQARIKNAIDQLGIGTAVDVNRIVLEMNKVEQGLVSSLPAEMLATVRQFMAMGLT